MKLLKKKEISFVLIFLGVFLVTFITLYLLGLVPGELMVGGNKGIFNELKLKVFESLDSSKDNNVKEPLVESISDVPLKVTIPKVDIDVSVSSPDTTDVNILDEYLKKGAVHYPGSGLVGAGNMFLFGHSSSLSVVQNVAYKAFSGIEKLKPGDEIFVTGEKGTYLYLVTSERKANADEVLVSFSNDKKMLTLSTCNTFGREEERFVVEADFIGDIITSPKTDF